MRRAVVVFVASVVVCVGVDGCALFLDDDAVAGEGEGEGEGGAEGEGEAGEGEGEEGEGEEGEGEEGEGEDACAVTCVADADFCDGVEACDENGACVGVPPCGDRGCDEAADVCGDCDDGGGFACVDDGAYCNGVAVCRDGACVSDPVVCAANEFCDEASDRCADCDDDADCGAFCDGRRCLAGHCAFVGDACPGGFCDDVGARCVACRGPADCGDDGDPCNGENVCDDGACAFLPPQGCASGLVCRPSDGSCVRCLADADCADTSACNGRETCVDGACLAGADPCTTFNFPNCLESSGAALCVECRDDGDCEQFDPCRPRTCDPGTHFCGSGPDPCPDRICDAGFGCRGCVNDDECFAGSGGALPHCKGDGTCVVCTEDSQCQNGSACDGSELCLADNCVDRADVSCGMTGTCAEPSGACLCSGISCATSSAGPFCFGGACHCQTNADCGGNRPPICRANGGPGTCSN